MINKEYIEREALLNEIQEEVDYELSVHTDNETKWMCGGLRVAMRDIRNRPTADVVPRDDVRRIFEEIEQELVAALESNYRVYREHLEKYGDKSDLEFLCICNAKINTLRGIEGFIEELKEKYMKGDESDA